MHSTMRRSVRIMFAFLCMAVLYICITSVCSHGAVNDEKNKIFYAEGSKITIREISDADRNAYPDDTLGKTVKVQFDDGSETYYLTSDYTIYGGGSEWCDSTQIMMFSGNVAQIVAGGSTGDTQNSIVCIYGGDVKKIAAVEDGKTESVSFYIDNIDMEVSELYIGAEKDRKGSFGDIVLQANSSPNITLKIGYKDGRLVSDFLKDEESENRVVVNLSGSNLKGTDQFEKLPNCMVNNRKYIILDAQKGTFKESGENIEGYMVSFVDEDGAYIYNYDTDNLPKPEREGYRFIGWAFDKSSNDTADTISNWVNKLYAVWRKESDPRPYNGCLYYSEFYPGNDESSECGAGIVFDSTIIRKYVPKDYDKDKGLKVTGYYPNGEKFEKEITISEDGIGYCVVESTSIDKKVTKRYIISIELYNYSNIYSTDFYVKGYDKNSVDNSGVPTKEFSVPINRYEAVSEDGAVVRIPYGSMNDNWELSVTGYVFGLNAGIKIGNEYVESYTEQLVPEGNAIEKEYIIRDTDGTDHKFKVKIIEDSGESTDIKNMALGFWDGETYDKYGNINQDLIQIDLDEARTEKGVTVTAPYYYDNENSDGIYVYYNYDTGFGMKISGLEEKYYLNKDGTRDIEFTVKSANNKKTQKYKITLEKDQEGDSVDLKTLNLVCYDVKTREAQKVAINPEAAGSEAGANVVALFDRDVSAGQFNIEVETKDFAKIYTDEAETAQIYLYQEVDIYRRPAMYNKTNDTLEFTVVSANGKNTKKYKVTAWQYGAKQMTDISTLSVLGISDKEYTGKAIEQDLVIMDGDKVLTAGSDYLVKYENNIKSGKAGMTIIGLGDYTGTLAKSFMIYKDGNIASDLFANSDIIRIAGNNRYSTSTAAADALKKSLGVDKFENIIVASGADYPDALAGSYLAKVKIAPVMLVGKDAETEADVKQYISKNLKKGGTVYLLGGTGVVTSRFEKSLGDLKVERLGGQTRYETNIAILKAAGVDKEDLLVCTGEGFADSLSASAVGKPILLVAKAGINDTQEKYLDSIKINDIYLIGGIGVVSDSIGRELRFYDQNGKCERIAGQNRYLTSVAVAKEFFPKGSDSAVLAYAMNFPDGLAGGPLALSIKAPLILTDNSGYGSAVDYAKSAGIKKAAVLGGSALISDGIVNKMIK